MVDVRNGWRLFRIPIAAFQTVGAPDPSRLLAIRLVLDTMTHALPLQIAGIRLAGVPAPPGSQLVLNQNRPNPFNPSTVITFELPESGLARLEIYDVAGRRIAKVVDETLDAGPQRALWSGRDENGRPVASGVYFYRLWTPRGEISRRMVLMK